MSLIRVVLVFLGLWAPLAFSGEPVTLQKFARAESDVYMQNFLQHVEIGQLHHNRTPTPIDEQTVIRMNRDTLYSTGVFDLSSPVQVSLPESSGRFQSLHVINQDHHTVLLEHNAGDYTITRDMAATRYVALIIRTFVDPENEVDVERANQLQDRVAVAQKSRGSFDVPNWDKDSLSVLRKALNELSLYSAGVGEAFGTRQEVDPVMHLLGTAVGWGGNPKHGAMYESITPQCNDGKAAYTLTVKDVPVDGFWSVTVYNADGFMDRNPFEKYSINTVTAESDGDGATTIHFGGNPENPNFLPISAGWSYVVRLYRPREQVLNGSWVFPQAVGGCG